MTREEAMESLRGILTEATEFSNSVCYVTEEDREPLEMAIKALEIEPLTDTEQRIFFAAISREEKVCKKVCADGDGIDLVAVCHSIERKVKKALWG